MDRRWGWLLLGLVACESKVLVAEAPRPAVMLTAPAEGSDVTYGVPFPVTALVVAPPGGRLLALELTTRGAGSERRTLPLTGESQTVTTELRIDRDEWLGVDGQALEMVLIAEAELDGQRRASLAAGVTVYLTDRRGPELSVRPPEGTGRVEGFDWALPGGVPVQVQLTAQDPSGGVVTLGALLPPALGGDRRVVQAPAAFGSVAFTLEPPLNGDLELSFYAEDGARSPNRTTKTMRVRFGEGGVDQTPPTLQIVAPPTLECGVEVAIEAIAEDQGAGPERLTLSGLGGSVTRYGPEPVDPERLRAELPLRPLALGPVELVAVAQDRAGQIAEAELSVAVVDSAPPSWSPPTGPFPEVAPGAEFDLELLAEERCGQLDAAILTVSDGLRTVQAESPLSGPRWAGPATFDIPRGICTLGPLEGGLWVRDQQGLATATVTLALSGVDRADPEIQLSTLVPSNGLEPGEPARAEVVLFDPETGVRSATVSLSATGLVGPGILAELTAQYPVQTCAQIGLAPLSFEAQIPADVRFGAPEATLTVAVEAEDHAGRRRRVTTDLRLVDRAPPELLFLPAPEGPVALPGEVRTFLLILQDRHHDLDQVTLTVTGPAQLAGAGTQVIPLNGSTATVTVDLQISASAGFDLPIRVEALATDTARLPNAGRTSVDLSTCGPPGIGGIAPAAGPSGGGHQVTVTGSGFRSGVTELSLGGELLEDVVIESATVARGRVPLGPHPPGLVELQVLNRCGPAVGTNTQPGAHRYAAPPSLFVVRPGPGSTATPGERLAVLVGAEADGVELTALNVTVGQGGPGRGLGRRPLRGRCARVGSGAPFGQRHGARRGPGPRCVRSSGPTFGADPRRPAGAGGPWGPGPEPPAFDRRDLPALCGGLGFGSVLSGRDRSSELHLHAPGDHQPRHWAPTSGPGRRHRHPHRQLGSVVGPTPGRGEGWADLRGSPDLSLFAGGLGHGRRLAPGAPAFGGPGRRRHLGRDPGLRRPGHRHLERVAAPRPGAWRWHPHRPLPGPRGTTPGAGGLSPRRRLR
jgi:hypothetical protein